ncbi:MAG: ATP-dependent helicase DinG [Fimbriimonadaceae bacterium]|jgi:ATP-dependent DNA helicase DinG|nr:ATP-dependent helicase DinG [Fimbriimonadaceae bacterium]
MSTARRLIEKAFTRLEELPGYVRRQDQLQLALLLSDLIEGKSTGAFEAPTGLGKSLASLIPSIAHSAVDKSRIIISTYTNVLAEQYWKRDLPLALSLFDEEDVAGLKRQFLIGRQRYACLSAMEQAGSDITEQFKAVADLGIESEFNNFFKKGREGLRMWGQLSAPPVCPGRLCPNYGPCYYYRARREAEKAGLVITNHSVVIQDGVLAKASTDGKGLLGEFDFMILDEAHDLYQAAASGLEFELSDKKLGVVAGIISRLEEMLLPTAGPAGDGQPWLKLCEDVKQKLDRTRTDLIAYSMEMGRPGILAATPAEVWSHPAVRAQHRPEEESTSRRISDDAAALLQRFVEECHKFLEQWREWGAGYDSLESARNYLNYLESYALGCKSIFDPAGVAVSYLGLSGTTTQLRQDQIDLSEPLQDLLWNRAPWACLSATLALDGNFDHFKRLTGAQPEFEEVLPSPFDFGVQAAVYVPRPGVIPDPSLARKEGTEDQYYRAIANELEQIIRALGGRTLALFHSRKEMEGVRMHVDLPPEFPILMQGRGGVAATGEKFVKHVNASLFALRSFWTGFDAPGETLSCVALVRVPFEVPIDPTPIARMAWLHSQGLDPFRTHTLPGAKMMMRQGAGRLIRRAEDRGIIALLDPRLKTKRYGEEILANLPSEMRTFDDIEEAVSWIGIGPLVLA